MKLSRPLVLAASTWVPETRERAREMVVAGRLDAEDSAAVGVAAVPVSTELSAPEMAVRAAQSVLAEAAVDAAGIDVLAHGWTYYQGHDFWSPAHFIADQIGARAALPLGVQQLSNAGAAALGIAVDRLTADPSAQSALVTTADRFALPAFDRWSADYGVVYGDSGTAVLLRRCGPDEARGTLLLRALATATDASFEGMYRGRDDFSAAPLAHSGRVDVRRPKKAYLELTGGMGEFASAAPRNVERALRQALADAEVEPGDERLACVLLPRLSDSVLDLTYRPVLDGVVNGQVLTLREDSGHLGAGDLAANIEYLGTSGRLRSGDLAVVLGGGGGFTWSCAVLEAT